MRLYFLSIIVNILSSCILMVDDFGDKLVFLKKIGDFFKGLGTKLLVACSAMLISLLKLMFPAGTDQIPFIGDLFPMVAGFLLGGTLMLDAVKKKSEVENQSLEKMEKLVLKNKGLVGLICLIIAFLHFLFAEIPIF